MELTDERGEGRQQQRREAGARHDCRRHMTGVAKVKGHISPLFRD